MTESPRSIVVIGGGLAGLAAAQRFTEAGQRVTVIEADPEVGGLAGSWRTEDGYWYDNGPHRLYSNLEALNDHFKEVLDGNWDYRDRLSRIYLKDRFIDYPLRTGNVVRGLPTLTLVRAFFDYAAIRVKNVVRPTPDDNFEAWIINRFGRTMYELFFGVYTRKTWGIPGTEISADWASQRISLLNLWDTVKKTLFKPKNVPRTYVSRFLYPKQGGIGALALGYRRMIERDGGTVIVDAPVTAFELDDDEHRVRAVTYTKDGAEHRVEADTFVSTIPLTSLVPMLGDALPPEAHAASDALVHKGIIFVYLKLDREQVTPDHWVYIPEDHIKVHRISEFKNFAEDCAPAGKTMVCAEITASKDDEYWRMDDRALSELAAANLAELGLIETTEVVGSHVRRVDYAYPIYNLTYRDNLRTLMKALEGLQNLISTGRQGLFRYGNMDHSVAMGHKVARRVLHDSDEDHSKVASGEEYFG